MAFAFYTGQCLSAGRANRNGDALLCQLETNCLETSSSASIPWGPCTLDTDAFCNFKKLRTKKLKRRDVKQRERQVRKDTICNDNKINRFVVVVPLDGKVFWRRKLSSYRGEARTTRVAGSRHTLSGSDGASPTVVLIESNLQYVCSAGTRDAITLSGVCFQCVSGRFLLRGKRVLQKKRYT